MNPTLRAEPVPASQTSPGAGAAHPSPGVRPGRPYESQELWRVACRALSFSQQVASLSAFLPMSRSRCCLLRAGCRRGAGAGSAGLCGPGAQGGDRNPPTSHRY